LIADQKNQSTKEEEVALGYAAALQIILTYNGGTVRRSALIYYMATFLLLYRAILNADGLIQDYYSMFR